MNPPQKKVKIVEHKFSSLEKDEERKFKIKNIFNMKRVHNFTEKHDDCNVFQSFFSAGPKMEERELRVSNSIQF